MKEWREADLAAERNPDPFQKLCSVRYAQTCQIQADRELLNLARRIYFEGTREEKSQMPSPREQPEAFVNWAKSEARSSDVQHRRHWEGIPGRLPTSPPSDTEEVDPWPYLCPAPDLDCGNYSA